MGKLHKRFNWKSRQIVETIIDDTEQKKIKVDFENDARSYDASNALVLPSEKRKTKKIKDSAPTKLLSKKQRKKLLYIQEKKLKRSKREKLLEELQKVQAKPKDMIVLTSLQSVQTMGRKKYQSPSFATCTKIEEKTNEHLKNINYLKWKTPKSVKRELNEKQQPPQKRVKDLGVVQSESSSSSEDENSESEETSEDCSTEIVVDEKCDQKGSEQLPNNRNDLQEKTEDFGNEFHQKEKNDDKDHQNSKKNHDSSFKGNKKECAQVNKGKENGIDSVPNCDTKTEKISESQSKKSNCITKSFRKVLRDPEVQKMRLKLPILSEEHTVMENINENPITIIVGQTGSGKTTQVPQFLYEAGYTSNGKMIGVTEPRRVAAISMAERVGFEMSLSPNKISYQVRFEGNTTEQTEIKFMTDGVLFKEILQSHLLENYSAIIIDEAHERSVHSDILIGLLSRIVPKRNKQGNPLKLIIMSATLRIEDFTENANLFRDPKPPVVKIEPRMFDVTIHFNRQTDPDYCAAAYKKVCNIHRQLPDGGILLFLTGQQEIKDLCKKLKATFPTNTIKHTQNETRPNFHKRIKDKKEKAAKHKKKRSGFKIPEINLKNFSSPSCSAKNGEKRPLSDEDGSDDDVDNTFLVEAEQPLWVLPLYAVLPRYKQKQVFEPPPEGTRLCVIATNVAETSLTIPSIKYVVDSGKTKEKLFDPVTGVSSYRVVWTSKASTNQRAGRAGRTTDGFCYRLYSSAVFNDEFEQYSLPDMRKRPLDDVVLTMKALRVPLVKFPFPTPPDPVHLNQSIKRLTVLGALREEVKRKKFAHSNDRGVITEMGHSMAALPVAPRFAKMILYGNQHEGILSYVLLLIAALTVQEVFIEIPLGSKHTNVVHKYWESQRLKWSGTGPSHLLGDPLVLIQAILEAEQNKASFQWCHQNGIRHAALAEIRKLRRQLTNEINLLMPQMNLVLDPLMKPPTDKQACIIAEVVLMGSLDQVARRVEGYELDSMEDKQKWKNAYKTLYSEKPVFLSAASSLQKNKPKYVMYQDIHEATKIYLRVLTVVDEMWLAHHGADLVDLSPPLDVPLPKFDSQRDEVVCWRKGTFGPHQWPLGECQLPYPVGKDLFKWVAYFFLVGELWPVLKDYVANLYDPRTLISPISLRFREKRENLIKAFMLKNVTSSKALKEAWKEQPSYLKSQYLAWFEDSSKVQALIEKWPPVKDETWHI